MDQEFEVKPEVNITKEKFENDAIIMLENLEEFKKLDAMMKQLVANCKQYMIDNDLEYYKNEHGKLMLSQVKRNMLDRSLIDDIKKYYVEKEFYILGKSGLIKKKN